MKKFLSVVKAREGDGADSPEMSDDYSSDNFNSNVVHDCSVS